MIRILFLFFVLIPLLELYVLIEVGSGIGGLTTIALCLLTAAVGGMIIRVQGLQTLLQAKKSMQQHELAEHGLHGVMLVIAGVFLFIPGFITDTLGFLLLVPAVRRWIVRKTYKPFPHAADVSGHQHQRYPNVEVIDVEIIKKD
ncbi:MAG: FxsA family protein [Ghiorsea sp.]|nr:FxsA family protein [Ghiorsea sp.]MDQ7057750.1 FxsA family protein [Ghiorsea sp.]